MPVNPEAMTAWDAVEGDMESTASGYEAAGWETIVCHPGDVAVHQGEDRRGVDVLLPNDEYEAVEAAVEESEFDEYEVLTATHEGVVFAVVVMQDTDRELALLFPTYFEPDQFLAVAGDTVTVYLRQLQGEYVELELEEPDLFLPDDDS